MINWPGPHREPKFFWPPSRPATRPPAAFTAVALATSRWAGPALAAKMDGVPVDASFNAAERSATLLKVANADAGGLKGHHPGGDQLVPG